MAADAVNRARDLQHMPPNQLGPEQLAERAREIAAAHPTLRVEVWDERKIAARGMGAFAAVDQASSRPARLIVLRHTPRSTARTARDVVLGMVGKGLTYDSGGYSLKPATAMTGMKFDMSGAAAVLEASDAIAELQLPLQVRHGGRRHREHDRHQRLSRSTTSSQPPTARRSRSPTPTPRAGWCWPTACTTPARWARPT